MIHIEKNFFLNVLCPLLQMYVTCTVQAKGTRLAKPVLSLGLMCLAFLTGLNRVAEYRNHWSDVIAGFLIGTAIATFLVRILFAVVVHGAVCLHKRSVSIHSTARKAADGSNGLHLLCTHGDKRDMKLVIRDFFWTWREEKKQIHWIKKKQLVLVCSIAAERIRDSQRSSTLTLPLELMYFCICNLHLNWLVVSKLLFFSYYYCHASRIWNELPNHFCELLTNSKMESLKRG